MSQREGQLLASAATPGRNRATPLEKVGWGMLGVAAAVWVVTSLLLVYGGASAHTGWSCLVAFVTLIVVGFALIVMGGPIERALFRGHPPHDEPLLSVADCSWVEHWEELMRRPVH